MRKILFFSMSVKRGEILSVNFELPQGAKEHPVLVISNDTANKREKAFLGVMLSGTQAIDEFSFELDNSMVTNTPKKKTQVRCHLITLIPEAHIKSRHGNMHEIYVDKVVSMIVKDVLN